MMSYFWDSKPDKVYKLRFAKKDSKEEFIDYIGKLMIDQFWYLEIVYRKDAYCCAINIDFNMASGS